MPPLTVLKSRLRSTYPFHITPFHLRWSDNDQYGHLNNAYYYHLYDTIVNTYLIEHCALSPSPTPTSNPSNGTSSGNQKVIGLCVRSESDFFRPVGFPARLDLGLAVRKLGRRSVVYEIGIFEEEGKKDEVVAVGRFVHVFVGAECRRPVERIPREMREGLEKLVVEELKREQEVEENDAKVAKL